MTQTSTPRIVRISVEDVRPGDVIVNEVGERLYAAFDVWHPNSAPVVRVFTAQADMDRGIARVIEVPAEATVLIALPALEVTEAPAPLVLTPRTALVVCEAAGAHTVSAHTVTESVVRIECINPGHSIRARNALIQAGYVAVRTGSSVIAHPDDPYFD